MGQMISWLTSVPKQLPLPVRTGYGWFKRKFEASPIWDNPEFQHTYHWLLETQWWRKDQLEEFQLEQLKDLVKHAYDNVPYYRRVFDKSHLKPGDISTLEDLQKLPLLTREDIRNNIEDLVARNFDREALSYVTTSGSTGQPLALYRDNKVSWPREAAFTNRQWSWAGYRRGDPIAILRGNLLPQVNPPGRRAIWDYNVLENELILSSFDMTEDNMRTYVEKLTEFRPKYIFAFPSSLEILGRYVQSQGSKLGFTITATFLESETLFPWQRTLIETQFDCQVFPGYGHTERAVDAVECEQHDGYHVSMEYGILELVDKNGLSIRGSNELGRVVGTGFGSYCMPLIRYATDDLAEFSEINCNCRRQLTVVKNFQGRIKEFVVSRTGHLVSLSSLNTHEPIGRKIREMKYIQEKEGELMLQVAKAEGYDESEIKSDLLKEFYQRLSKDEFELRIIFVDNVSRNARQKIGFLDQKLPIDLGDLDRAQNVRIGKIDGS